MTIHETIQRIATQQKESNYRIDRLFRIFTDPDHDTKTSAWSISAVNSLIHAVFNSHTPEEIDDYINEKESTLEATLRKSLLETLTPEQTTKLNKLLKWD